MAMLRVQNDYLMGRTTPKRTNSFCLRVSIAILFHRSNAAALRRRTPAAAALLTEQSTGTTMMLQIKEVGDSHELAMAIRIALASLLDLKVTIESHDSDSLIVNIGDCRYLVLVTKMLQESTVPSALP
jgi:hypothetical protein